MDAGYALISVFGGTGFARAIQAEARPLQWAAVTTPSIVAAWRAAVGIRRDRAPVPVVVLMVPIAARSTGPARHPAGVLAGAPAGVQHGR